VTRQRSTEVVFQVVSADECHLLTALINSFELDQEGQVEWIRNNYGLLPQRLSLVLKRIYAKYTSGLEAENRSLSEKSLLELRSLS
jgi:hypothetical protein